MKRILALLLSMTLLMSMQITAFAVTETNEIVGIQQRAEKSVDVTYVENNTEDKVYHITVVWEIMDFSYTSGGKVWNSEELKYDGVKAGTWNPVQIYIANRSNVQIYPHVEFVPINDDSNISVDWNVMDSDGGGSSAEEGSMMQVAIERATEGMNDLNLPYVRLQGTFSGNLDEEIDAGKIEKNVDTGKYKVGTLTVLIPNQP